MPESGELQWINQQNADGSLEQLSLPPKYFIIPMQSRPKVSHMSDAALLQYFIILMQSRSKVSHMSDTAFLQYFIITIQSLLKVFHMSDTVVASVPFPRDTPQHQFQAQII